MSGLQTVILGPRVDLHPGIHGSLTQQPPEGVVYHQRSARHHFLLAADPTEPEEQEPFESPHLGEFVDFGPGPQLVHTARWPVLNRKAWVTDMDDFGYPLVIGRYLFKAQLEGSGDRFPDGQLSDLARMRTRTMLSAYGHPSCKAILFRTRKALDGAAAWIEHLELEDEGRPFLEKGQVVYPAERPLLPTLFRQKWRRPEPFRILFVGNDYEAKNGRLALRVLGRLARNHPEVRCTYVGTIPEEDFPLAEAVDYRGSLPRIEVLKLFRTDHVLFHPTKAESFGMVFAEAAANGLAIVTARGRGMEHLGELLDDRGAQFLNRANLPAEGAEEECFYRLLEVLIENPRRAHFMGLANYDLARHGKLSIAARDDKIRRVYRAAESMPAERGLSLDETATSGSAPTLILSSARVSAAHRAFRDKNGICRLNFHQTNSIMQTSTAFERQYRAAYRETF